MLLKKLLLITYHFPPSAASGAFRLLGFARHLPANGWQPLVVAPPTLPWEPIDVALADQVPAEALVRHVPYPSRWPRIFRMLAQHAVWLPGAWSAARQVASEERPDAILTSGPPHCVHVLGHYLKRATGLPWVADFRDPWISNGSAKSLTIGQRWERSWERRVFACADLVLANAPNACAMFRATYPQHADKIVTLTNGFDPRPSVACAPANPEHLRLLHAGEIYAGRDPMPLLEALVQLNADGAMHRLQVLGRCDESPLPAVLRERGWTDLVQMEGQRSYDESLDAMSTADVLVLFDSPGRRIGVPAKLYEYLGTGRPILALAEPDGDTAAILRASGVLHRIAPPRDMARIATAIREIAAASAVQASRLHHESLQQFTRAALTRSLASQLDAMIGERNLAAPRPIDMLQEASR